MLSPSKLLCRYIQWWNQDPHAAGSSILPYEQGMFSQNRDNTSYSDSIHSESKFNTYKCPNCATPVSTLSVASSSTTPMTFKDGRNSENKDNVNAENKDDSPTEQDITFNSDTSIWTTGTEHTAVRWRSAPSRLGEKISQATSLEYVSRLSLTSEEDLLTLEAAATNTAAVVVGTNAIKEVATPTFSTTSSVHGADFAVTKSTANVSLSDGLAVVQTIDATTTALPTAATLGHPDTPNATQSVVRTGTPTTTSTTTATRMSRVNLAITFASTSSVEDLTNDAATHN
nr:unnamed protein product [Spirometra erinaceieuropaei]